MTGLPGRISLIIGCLGLTEPGVIPFLNPDSDGLGGSDIRGCPRMVQGQPLYKWTSEVWVTPMGEADRATVRRTFFHLRTASPGSKVSTPSRQVSITSRCSITSSAQGTSPAI